MTNWKSVDAMSEKDFETLLEDNLADIPPEDIVREVTPWRKAMNRVLVGMALCAITLNFCCLDYIMPAIGMTLLILGFRTLRCDNPWFKTCFITTVLRAAYFFPLLVLNSTAFHSKISAADSFSIPTLANLLLIFISLFCLWRGLRSVQIKAGLPSKAGSAAALILWYVLMCALALFQYSGLIIAGLMIIAYIFIIRNLWKISRELDEAGYSVQAAPNKVSDRFISLSLIAVLVIGCAIGYAFFSSYTMEWTEVTAEKAGGEKNDNTIKAKVEAIETHLLELGFPESALGDISEEDILACENAVQVVVDMEDEDNLRITGIGVEIAGERESWVIFHHFLWTDNPKFYGTECIQLWPSDRLEGWDMSSDVSGQVLYDEGEKTFSSPYYFLGPKTFTTNSFLIGNQTSTDIFAAFSMPRNGENQRGYLAYTLVELEDGWIIDSWFNYTHQRSWLQYPAMTALDKRMTSSWNEDGAFITVQDALQFYPTEEGIEMIS